MKSLKPLRSEKDYEQALVEVERLWDAKARTPNGDRLDILAPLIDAYESQHYPMDPPDPIEAIKFRMETAGADEERSGWRAWHTDTRIGGPES
jgi:HTH-type transcriptional regulator/antitoxin HigA